MLDRNQVKEGESNVFGANCFAPKGYLAYFKKFSSGIFNSTLYCPVVELSAQNKIYLPRSRDEKLAIADHYYQVRNYQAALGLLNQVAGFDLASIEAVQKFNLEQIFYIQKDTTQVREFWKDVASDVFLRAALVLRKLDKPEPAERLLQQYRQFCHVLFTEQIKDSTANEKISEEIFWNGIYIYSHLGETAAGVSDFISLKSAAPGDSIFNACIVLSQAFFANSNGNPKQTLEFIETLSQIMPKRGDDQNDLWNMAALLWFNPSNFNQPRFEKLRNLFMKKFSNSDLESLGDLYLEIKDIPNAFKAYQSAVTNQFDKDKIWEKIFELDEDKVK
jgi:hypothetical protein